MNSFELFGFSVLGLSILTHLVFVNITIGTGWISVVTRLLGWLRKDEDLELMSKRIFKILVVTELFSGVWGTIITVILAALFPGLLAIATDVMFYPILIALVSIIIRIPLIAVYWYSWNKINPKTHILIGFIMATAGLGVPMGFRYIFAEITSPYALLLALQGAVEEARLAIFFNPLYPSLILHTWAGALLIGGLITSSYFASRNNFNTRYARIGIFSSVIFLFIQLIVGGWYILSLMHYSPLLFRNLMMMPGSSFNAAPLLTVKIILIGIIAHILYRSWRVLKNGNGIMPRGVAYLGLIGTMMLIISEFLNDGARYPYFVLLGDSGLPPSFFMNVYMDLPLLVMYVILASLIIMTAAFIVIFYYALNRKFLEDAPT